MKSKFHQLIKSMFLIGSTLGTMAFVSTQSVNASTPMYDNLYSTATKYLGTKYVYGGTTPNGFDCSGYTKYVYKKGANKTLARTAQSQYDTTSKVSSSKVQKGDLVYFGASKNSISHVGLYIGNGNMIDSQNRGVIIEKVNSPWWNKVGYSRPTKLAYETGVKYNSVSMKMRVTGSHDFYSHVLGDNRYSRTLTYKASSYKNKIVSVNTKGKVDSNGNVFYRATYNGKNLGWVYATGLDNNAKYSNTTMKIKVNGSHDFYDHMSGDTKYSRKLINKGSAYKDKMVDVNCRGVVTNNGNIYYRASYNGQNIGWIYKTGLATNVSYKNVTKKMTVTGTNDFYNHALGDTRYVRKFNQKGSNLKGKTVTVNCQGTVSSSGSVYYRVSYNGINLGWVYKTGLK